MYELSDGTKLEVALLMLAIEFWSELEPDDIVLLLAIGLVIELKRDEAPLLLTTELEKDKDFVVLVRLSMFDLPEVASVLDLVHDNDEDALELERSSMLLMLEEELVKPKSVVEDRLLMSTEEASDDCLELDEKTLDMANEDWSLDVAEGVEVLESIIVEDSGLDAGLEVLLVRPMEFGLLGTVESILLMEDSTESDPVSDMDETDATADEDVAKDVGEALDSVVPLVLDQGEDCEVLLGPVLIEMTADEDCTMLEVAILLVPDLNVESHVLALIMLLLAEGDKIVVLGPNPPLELGRASDDDVLALTTPLEPREEGTRGGLELELELIILLESCADKDVPELAKSLEAAEDVVRVELRPELVMLLERCANVDTPELARLLETARDDVSRELELKLEPMILLES